jgi:pimeloyl-ACP methyl ester carboxylesterase
VNDGVLLVHSGADDEPGWVLVDEPARLRFRQRVADERLAEISLREVVAWEANRLDGWCGWYVGHDRRVLLTQFPEGYFGAPMVLVGDGDAVLRTYPIGDDRFVRADGRAFSLVESGRGDQAVLLGAPGSSALLRRDERVREREIAFRVDGDVLAGTLITPAGTGPHPAAVVVHGAAGGGRDFCRLFVEPVLAAGVAVFIYDKRGHGRSTGTPNVTIFDQAEAARAALDRIGPEPDIDADRLGLLGFSNGMWAVPLVAADRADVAFIVGIGSPGVSMVESEVHRRSKILREAGVGPHTVEAAGTAWRCILSSAATGRADGPLVAALSAALRHLAEASDLQRYPIPAYARRNPRLSAVPPAMSAEEVLRMLAGPANPELDHDPADDYARISAPILLQWGEQDTSVPVAVSVQRIWAALPDPGSATLRVYPDTEHMLNVVLTDVHGISTEEAMYGFHGFRFAPRVRDDLRDWLRSVLFSPGA